MALGAAQEKLDKYAQGGNTMKHEAGKDGVQIAMVVISGVKSIVTNGKNIAQLGGAADDLANLADDARKLVNGSIEEAAGKQLVKETKEALTDAIAIDKMSIDLADQTSRKGRKLTWDEVRALFKRGNDFNRKAGADYKYNEINFQNGKRLDSYNEDLGEIVSRKATSLNEIKFETFESYLKEAKAKYPIGSVIRSNKYPDLDGKILKGKQILEIPKSNESLPNIQEFINFAKNAPYQIEIRFKAE